VNIHYLIRKSYFLGLTAWLAVLSCANPTSPTGGPRDEKGPEVVGTEPESGATNYTGRTVTLHFSEWVNRSSMTQAVRVEPDIGIQHKLDWGRKSVKVVFEKKIPDSTTVIVTIGTDLKDTNGNEMSKPVSVAFSTGPTIDKGKLVGTVKHAETGEKESGMRVLLYKTPVDLNTPANYIGETDTSGTVNFAYLRQGDYKAFWVDDINRNKMWDRNRERAQPFSKEIFHLEKGGTDTLGTIYVQKKDTTNPGLLGIGLLSSRRLRLRFSEDIKWNQQSRINGVDSLGNAYSDVRPIYSPDDSKYILFAQSKKDFDPVKTYSLQFKGITDLAGNPVIADSMYFQGSAQKDTTQQRIIRNETANGLYSDQPVVFTYAAPISSSTIRDSLKVVVGDSLHEKWPNTKIQFNQLRVYPDDQWQPEVKYQIRTWNPITQNYKSVNPVIWSPNALGGIAYELADTTDTSTYYLKIFNKDAGIEVDTTFSKKVEIDKLPPMNYTTVVFRDENDNKSWDSGTVVPFKAPEPYYIHPKVPVKKGFTGSVIIQF